MLRLFSAQTELLGLSDIFSCGFFWAVLSRHEQVPRMQGWLWKGQSSPHIVVKWNGSVGISAAGLAGKHQLRVAILFLDSVPGLGASSPGWELLSCGTLVLWGHDMKLMLSVPERRKTQWQSLWEGTHPRPQQRGWLRCLSSLQRQQGRQPGWLRSTESVKRSKTQGKSFSRSPAGFALTLPHLVWGRQESGYYEHFLFIKPELQGLICLLGKVAEYKAVPCPSHTTCAALGTAAPPAPQRWQRLMCKGNQSAYLDCCAKQDPDFPGPLSELWFGTQQCFTFAPSPGFCWCQGRYQWSTECFITTVLMLFSVGKPWEWPSPRKQSNPHCCLHKGWHFPRESDPGSQSHFCWEGHSQAELAFQTQMATTLRLKSLAAPQRKSKGKFTKGPYVSESF